MNHRPSSLLLATVVMAIGVVASPLRAGENTVSNVNLTKTDGVVETGWVLQIPAGPSDFFSVAYDLGPALPPEIRNGTLKGVAFVVPQTPRVGFYQVPISGPGLGQPISEVFNPSVTSEGYVDLPDVDLATLPDGHYFVAMQFPPGDPGLLGEGADSDGTDGGDGTSNPFDSSYYSTDGFQTPAIPFTQGDFELNLVIDPKPSAGGVLRTTNNLTVHIGDYDLVARHSNEDVGVSFHGPNPAGDVWLLFLATPTGVPIQPISSVLTTVPDGDGDYARLAGKLPPGLSNVTFHFVAAWGNATSGQFGFSNVIAIQVP